MIHVDNDDPQTIRDESNKWIAECIDPEYARKFVMAYNAPGFVHWWASKTFPDRTPKDVLIKLFEEIGEYAKSPSAAGELADMLILIYDLALMHGIDPHKAVYDKMMVNQRRNWHFNKETGVAQHDPDNA